MNRIIDNEADITINDAADSFPGRFTVEQVLITLAADHPTRPDLDWTMIDSAGHFHAYATDGALPTLKERTRNRCGGWNEPEFRCRICEQAIVPGRIPEHEPRKIPGPRSWFAEFVAPATQPPVYLNGLVTTTADASAHRKVTARLRTPDRMYFGVALLRAVGAVAYGDQDCGTAMRLDGLDALGERGLYALDPAAASAQPASGQQPQQ